MTKFTGPLNIGVLDSDATVASIDVSGTAQFAQVNGPVSAASGTLGDVTVSTALVTQLQIVTAAVTASTAVGSSGATVSGWIVVEVCGGHAGIPYYKMS